MDTDVIVSMIGSLGFPIVACIYLMYMQQTTMKDIIDSNTKLSVAIEKLISKLGGVE